MKIVTRLQLIVPIVFCHALIAGCTEKTQLPPGSKITFFPAIKRFGATGSDAGENASCQPGTDIRSIPVRLNLTTSEGMPVGQQPVTLFAETISVSAVEQPFVSLYLERQQRKTDDSRDAESNEHVESTLTVETRSFSGDANFWMRVDVSCAHDSVVYAYARHTVASLPVAVAPEPLP